MSKTRAPEPFFEAACNASTLLSEFGQPIVTKDPFSVRFDLGQTFFEYSYDWRDHEADLSIGHRVLSQGKVASESFSINEILSTIGRTDLIYQTGPIEDKNLQHHLTELSEIARSAAAPFLNGDESSFAAARLWQAAASRRFLRQNDRKP